METYLTYEIVYKPDNADVLRRARGDYLVQPEVDGVGLAEIKGWIKEDHVRHCSGYFLRSESIPLKTTRPQKNVERYTTQIKYGKHLGKMETSIVRVEKEIEEPQLSLFRL